MTLEELIAFHEICQVKYRYLRGVDTQDWDLVASVFSANASTWYDSGKLAATGGKAIAAMLKSAMVSSIYSTHIAIHPEITFTSPTTANGKWRMQDIVHFTAADPAIIIPDIKGGEELSGVAYYHDEYLKEADGWKIAKMGYVRIFEALKRPNFIHLQTTPARGKITK
jgi:hypothetical protein